jgi:hypothetical protein
MRFWLSGPRVLGIRPGITFRLDELLRKPSPRSRPQQLQGRFIYIISGNHGLIKIGVSSNPSARLAQLQTASAVPLTIAYLAALRCNGYAVEAAAHETLAGYRQNGEWFSCPVDMAVAAISAAAYRLGEPIASGDPKLADEVVRIAASEAAAGLPARIVLAIIKFLIAIPLTLMIWASFYIIYLLATTPRPSAF